MGLRGKFEDWMIRKEFNQDTFQSFVCWMLLFGTVFSFFTPAYLVIFQNAADHCGEGTFTVLAHYRIHSWLYEMFEEFKASQTDYDNVCFELIISDSQFSSSDDPAIWIPENTVWLDEAESDSEVYGSSLIKNRTKSCSDTSNIPMGLLTWLDYAEILNYETPLNYSLFLKLAQDGWSEYTDEFDANTQLSFSHAHPNVTSSGVLGMVLGYQTQIGLTQNGDRFSYSSNIIKQYSDAVRSIESNIHEAGPNELHGVSTFLGHGPDYVHAMYGFENNVAYNNHLYSSLLEALWEDSLAFIYFSSSFWMSHPACVLTDASYLKDKQISIAEKFQQFITNETRLERLLDWGIRPAGVSDSVLQSSNVLSSDNGVNPTITTSNTNKLKLPSYTTIEKMREEWQHLKEPVYLRILLDTSGEMKNQISGKNENRWARATRRLTYFAEVLEDNAIVEIVCFADNIIPCGDTSYPEVSYANGTLEYLRNDIITYIDETLRYSEDRSISLYKNLNITLNDIRAIKEDYDSKKEFYNYVIVVISEDDNEEKSSITTEELLDVVGINYSADEVHVFSISFFGETGGETAQVLEEIAVRTNGEFYDIKDNMPSVLEEIGWYF